MTYVSFKLGCAVATLLCLTTLSPMVHAACSGYPAGVAATDQVLRFAPPATPYVNPIASSNLASPEEGATVYCGKGHYLFSVKKNQPELHDAIAESFGDLSPLGHTKRRRNAA